MRMEYVGYLARLFWPPAQIPKYSILCMCVYVWASKLVALPVQHPAYRVGAYALHYIVPHCTGLEERRGVHRTALLQWFGGGGQASREVEGIGPKMRTHGGAEFKWDNAVFCLLQLHLPVRLREMWHPFAEFC